VVDDVVAGPPATDITVREAALAVDTVGAAPVEGADPGADSPFALAPFEAVDVAQSRPHVGWIAVGVGVAVERYGVGLRAGDAGAEVHVDQHVAEEE
jgi:hypothetical protein